jgi:hypothetical protein
MAIRVPGRTAVVHLAAAESSKVLVADPGDGNRIVVRRIRYISKTSAAQAMTVDDGTTNLLDLAASITAHTAVDSGEMEPGFACAPSEALTANPAAAGPAGTFIVNYFIEQTALG